MNAGEDAVTFRITVSFPVKTHPWYSLICARLHPLVYNMGGSVGGLERLHHLFLPGCRRPVQGETLKCQYFVLIWLYRVEFQFQQISLSVYIDFNKFQEDFLIFLQTANGPFYYANRNAQAVIMVNTYSFLSWIQSKYPELLWPSLLSSPHFTSPLMKLSQVVPFNIKKNEFLQVAFISFQSRRDEFLKYLPKLWWLCHSVTHLSNVTACHYICLCASAVCVRARSLLE